MRIPGDDEFAFRYNYLRTYLLELGREMERIREQTIQFLELARESDLPTVEIKGLSVNLSDLLETCKVMVKMSPEKRCFLDYEWLIEGSNYSIKETFASLEKYLRSVPYAKLPEKDPIIEAWWEKL
ncbi:MAG TPA: hypothetical protein DIC35_05370 [Candidatus Moranbacteria bacterium]|nr:hypothetical protein [Candidatus Moranbacteria bacterium]